MIEWLKEASFSGVARRMKLSWEQVDGLMLSAIARGLSRREACSPTRIGVDETSCQKGHEDVTVVTNLDNSIVVEVMDMWLADSNAVKRHLPNGKIAFDRFQIANFLPKATRCLRIRSKSCCRSPTR